MPEGNKITLLQRLDGISVSALVIAASYVIQVQSAAWYVRFSDRIFGPVESVA